MMADPRNPFPTVDVIIELPGGIVLVRRKNPPPGWALPGGFVDYGERVEQAVTREMKEETNLDCEVGRLVTVASRPDRDPRKHCVTVVYEMLRPESVTDRAWKAQLRAGDDAAAVELVPLEKLRTGLASGDIELAFDHGEIVARWLAESA